LFWKGGGGDRFHAIHSNI
jgi:hypothetical protein